MFVSGPQVDVQWHRVLSRPTGVAFPEEHANIVLLPWPLRVRARDFRAARYSLPHMDPSQFGFFTFDPTEDFDLGLAERVLRAAVDEAGTVDVVFLPECAITPADIEPLESLLGDYGVWCFIAGVREPPPPEGGFGANWVHVGIRQEIVWRHSTQHKHHRWCLDGRQISQYHLGGALSPMMRWWEAIAVPRRSLRVIDQGAVTVIPLLCEDLSRLEPVAHLVRSIGPSMVLTLLLDGPQLASRWTARYASVLADDPGSAVCTLTSAGLVRRCRPPGCEPSRVVALWKDATGELTEIELDDGAQAVLIATTVSVRGSTTADGRRHPGTTNTLRLAAVQSLHAATSGPPFRRDEGSSRRAGPHAGASGPPLGERELSKATSWAEAVAEAVVADANLVEQLLDQAANPTWREPLGLPPPSEMFLHAINVLRHELPRPPTVAAVFATTAQLRTSSDPTIVLTAILLEIALEQRLFTEVQAGRLQPTVFDQLAQRNPQ